MILSEQHNHIDSPIDWLRLHLAFLYQPQVAEELLERLGTPRAIFSQSPPPRGSEDGIPPAVRRILEDRRFLAAAGQEAIRSRRDGLSILCRGGPGWPENLRNLPSMPLVLFSRGTILEEDCLAVGIVGSRRPTPYGLRQAERFAGRLAALGITVVSGLARGIDAAAHLSALEAGGRTLAVLGSGLGRIYPRENQDLARRITGAGAVVSEFPWDAPPRQFHFPHRNRILSGLSRAILVIEAGDKSGSLITAEWAAEQGRDVFVVPGRVDGPEALGSLRLIQEGARLVVDPEEVAGVLGVAVSGTPAPAVFNDGAGNPGAAAKSLPAHLEPLFAQEDSWHADQLIQKLGRPPGQVLAELFRLEAAGAVRRAPDGSYTKGRHCL